MANPSGFDLVFFAKLAYQNSEGFLHLILAYFMIFSRLCIYGWALVRKVLGYQHIPQKWAQLINEFNQENLNPHVNYHRSCLFPKTIVDHKGKERKRYPYQLMMTPYEKLKSLPDAKKYLKDGVSFETIDAIAYEITDNQSAERLQKSRRQLFETINERELITG